MAAFVNVGTHRIIDYSFIPPTDYSTMAILSYSHPYSIAVPQCQDQSLDNADHRKSDKLNRAFPESPTF
jgi:hypothetical protein